MTKGRIRFETKPLKRLAKFRVSNVDKRSNDGEMSVRLCNYTDVYYADTITPEMDFMTATATGEEIRKFRLRVGDVLITKDSEDYLDIGVPAYVATEAPDLLCGYHLALLRPDSRVVHPRFLFWAMASGYVSYQFSAAATGLTRYGLRQDSIASAAIPCPLLDTQVAIAEFLDRETERIDRLVGNKRQLIKLLEEKRTALISHAVTKGLDPTVPLKDSGITWLGEIPAHWEVAPVYSRYSVFLGKMLSEKASAGPEPRPYLRNLNVQWDRIDLSDLAEMSFDSVERLKYRLQPGDLIVCEGGEVGRAAIWNGELKECYYQKALLRLRARSFNDLPRFLLHVLHAAAHMEVFRVEGNQATFVHLTGEKLRAHRFGFPGVAEQREIVAWIDNRVALLNEALGKIRQQLNMLAEYRQALITAAVTGQLDVTTEVPEPEEVVA